MNRQVAKSVVFLLISGNAVTMLAAPVIPDYDFKKVNGKPAVIPGFNLNASGSMGLTNPNPLDTGAGVGHQYLAVFGKNGSYDGYIQFFHRNIVTNYDYTSGSSFVEQINCGNDSNPQNDARLGSIVGPTNNSYFAFGPAGRMTHENYWVLATGGSSGPFYEWQPRDARVDAATSNQFLVYPDADPGADGVGVQHTITADDNWGCGGYNKQAPSLYAGTLDAGLPTERIRCICYGSHYSSSAWGSGLFEVGPWTAPADPLRQFGTRSRVNSAFFMSQANLDNLVPNIADGFRNWFHDGTDLFFLTATGTNVYLSAVAITNWTTGGWQQVDVSSGPEMYQTFSFNSGTAGTSLQSAGGLVFAPDPSKPSGPPLLYINNTKSRIFVLEAKVPAALGTVVLLR